MSTEIEETVEAAETDETAETVNNDTGTPETVTDAATDTVEPGAEEPADKTFPKVYVDQLRKENADYRVKAKDRDDIAQRLHEVLVARTGRLADATDLPFDEANLSDADAMTGAIEALLERKPHLASRKPSGDIGQGITSADDSLSLAGILRSNAR